MNTSIEISTGQLTLLIPYRPAGGLLAELITRLALRGQVQVLDGGNRFNAYLYGRAIARALASAPPGQTLTLTEALEHIRVARAFTCYQLLALLKAACAGPTPTLVLDLLATFYDESLPTHEARRLLEETVQHLRRLSMQAPVLVTARPPPLLLVEGRAPFLDMLAEAAGQVITLGAPPPPAPSQLPILWKKP